ncbi:hypothetical protein G7046_g718 [Stylonectria norvegica]|nr:hypothetical protein G7046_g718 [Stylonectria norvegica]
MFTKGAVKFWLKTEETPDDSVSVNPVYVTKRIQRDESWYIAMTLNRESCTPAIVVNKHGRDGMGPTNNSHPRKPISFRFSLTKGITSELVSRISSWLNATPAEERSLNDILVRLHNLFVSKDATLLEINNLARSSTGALLCSDTNFTFDDAAERRQKDLFALRDTNSMVAEELEAQSHGLVYIKMEGNIGNVVNGAGLAMATNDVIADHGGASANFLDAGGQATKKTMVKAFEIILQDDRVRSILVNIYGGIIKCDMIADSIIGAARELGPLQVPLVLKSADLGLFVESDFGEAAAKAVELAKVGDMSLCVVSGAPYKRLLKVIATLFTMESDDIEQVVGGAKACFTGKAASINAQDTIAYGTNIVGGVSPGKGGQQHLGLPVYGDVRQAVKELNPHASAVFVPAQFAAAAIIEAIEAEVPLVVSVAEHIPVHDMIRVHEVLRTQSRTRLVGPNCPGIIAPEQCRVGIMPHKQYSRGVVGIVSKSGTLSYEAVGSTTKAGLGQSLVVGMGGDMMPGTTLLDGLRLFFDHEETKGIIVIGEIGGEAELRAAEAIAEYRKRTPMPKPIVAMVAGRTAPVGRIMGHAGAVRSRGDASADMKAKALENSGAVVVPHPGVMGAVMKELLGL